MIDQLSKNSARCSLRRLGIAMAAAASLLASGLYSEDAYSTDSLTTARVGIYVNRIDEINVKDQSFNCDFYLYFKWRGVHSPERYEFVNGYNTTRRYETIETDTTGMKFLSVRIQGTFYVPMDISDYPFDSHRLAIVVENYDWPIEQLLFEKDRSTFGYDGAQFEGGWDTTGTSHRVDLHRLGDRGGSFSQYTAEVGVRRNVTPFFVKVFLPLLLVVIMSMLSFYLPAKEIEAQMSLGATALLSIIAFNYVIGDELPSVGYLTKADILILTSYLFVFSALAESVVTHWLFKRDQEMRAQRIDRRSRLLFPLCYAAIMLFIVVW